MDEIEFGRYRLRELVGQGGMGRVYKAYDTSFDRTVALKLLPPQMASDPAYRERFRREAHSAGNLSEPHIVPIYDFGEHNGHLYLTMPLIDGTDVGSLLNREGPLAPERAVSIIEQAAAALDAAHAKGLVHRDVKPANILVTAKNFVYLIDFGIARATTETGLTGTGATIGTMAYMAPERLESGRTDARTDVYALACVLFECLCKARPFPGNSMESVIAAHLSKPPPRPSLVRPGLPPLFDDVIALGMAKNPERRFASAGALARAARSALQTPQRPPHAPPPQAPQRPAPPSRQMPPPQMPPPQMPPPPRPEPARFAPAPPPWTPPPHQQFHPHVPPRRTSSRKKGPAIALGVGLVLVLVLVTTWFVTRDEGTSGDDGNTDTARPKYAVTSTVTVGDAPYGVAIDPETNTVYVANAVSNSVSVIDASSNAVTATIPVGAAPFGVAVVPEARLVYVTNFDGNSVSVIDSGNNTVTATIPVGDSPHGLAIDPGRSRMYVANHDSDTVSVIDTVKNTVTATIPVGDAPYGVAIDLGSREVYVANGTSNSVSVIDELTDAVTATIPVGEAPYGVAIDADTDLAYVANANSDSVSVIDLSSKTVTATITVGDLPGGVAIDSSTKSVYVTNANSDSVSVIDSSNHQVTDTITIGDFPCVVAVNPGARTVYVTNNGGDSMSVLTS